MDPLELRVFRSALIAQRIVIKTVRSQGVGDARAMVTEIFQRMMSSEAARTKCVRMAISEIFKRRSQELDARDCDEAEDYIVAECIPYFRDIIASQLPVVQKRKPTKKHPREISLDGALPEGNRTLLDVIPASLPSDGSHYAEQDDLEIASALASYLATKLSPKPDPQRLRLALVDIGQELSSKDTCFEAVFFPSGFSHKRGKPRIKEWKARALHAALIDQGIELDLGDFCGAFDMVPGR